MNCSDSVKLYDETMVIDNLATQSCLVPLFTTCPCLHIVQKGEVETPYILQRSH